MLRQCRAAEITLTRRTEAPEPPDRVLNEPRKRPGKLEVELPGVDLLGDRFDDFGAAAWPVTGGAIGMVGSEPVQDSGPVQEIVHQGVDRDHAAADFEPAMPTAWCAEEQLQLNV